MAVETQFSKSQIILRPDIIPGGLPITPHYNIPPELEAATGGQEGVDKGRWLEKVIVKTIKVHPLVKDAHRNNPKGLQDFKGHDITVEYTEESGIEDMYIQSKYNSRRMWKYRNRVSRMLKQVGSELTVDEWLILDRTIPLYGSADGEKLNEQEILRNFVFGAAKIVKLYEVISREHKYVNLFTEAGRREHMKKYREELKAKQAIQVFPIAS